MPLKRETIFDIVTDPPCHYCNVSVGRKVCEFWDVQGHYCFLKDIHSDAKKCLLVDKILEAHTAVIREIIDRLEEYNPNAHGYFEYPLEVPGKFLQALIQNMEASGATVCKGNEHTEEFGHPRVDRIPIKVKDGDKLYHINVGDGDNVFVFAGSMGQAKRIVAQQGEFSLSRINFVVELLAITYVLIEKGRQQVVEWGLERCPHWEGEATRDVGVMKRDCSQCWAELQNTFSIAQEEVRRMD